MRRRELRALIQAFEFWQDEHGRKGTASGVAVSLAYENVVRVLKDPAQAQKFVANAKAFGMGSRELNPIGGCR